MAEWENSVGESDEWYTPPEIFTALGLEFDIDVASPGADHWVPAKKVFTKEDDGLKQAWGGGYLYEPSFWRKERTSAVA